MQKGCCSCDSRCERARQSKAPPPLARCSWPRKVTVATMLPVIVTQPAGSGAQRGHIARLPTGADTGAQAQGGRSRHSDLGEEPRVSRADGGADGRPQVPASLGPRSAAAASLPGVPRVRGAGDPRGASPRSRDADRGRPVSQPGRGWRCPAAAPALLSLRTGACAAPGSP